MAETIEKAGETKVWIPDVPKHRIREMAKRIKPVVTFNGPKKSGPHFIKPVDLFEIAYTWDPKPAGKAVGLEPLCDITTYHSWAYAGFFKPTIAEVLAQIPAEHINKAVAFEIVDRPRTCADMNKEHEALNTSYHVATTRLYTRKQ